MAHFFILIFWFLIQRLRQYFFVLFVFFGHCTWFLSLAIDFIWPTFIHCCSLSHLEFLLKIRETNSIFFTIIITTVRIQHVRAFDPWWRSNTTISLKSSNVCQKMCVNMNVSRLVRDVINTKYHTLIHKILLQRLFVFFFHACHSKLVCKVSLFIYLTYSQLFGRHRCRRHTHHNFTDGELIYIIRNSSSSNPNHSFSVYWTNNICSSSTTLQFYFLIRMKIIAYEFSTMITLTSAHDWATFWTLSFLWHICVRYCSRCAPNIPYFIAHNLISR